MMPLLQSLPVASRMADPPSSIHSPRPHPAEPPQHELTRQRTHSPPPTLISPAFTPPSTPGTQTPTPAAQRSARSIPVAAPRPDSPRPELLATLPAVQCVVRARIPTVGGAETFLHLYRNDADDKEHLAIVFGGRGGRDGRGIRSRSLDALVPGETEMDRMVRGAYVGRLHPGRTSSRVDGDGGTAADGADDAPAPDPCDPPLVRIHSECYTGETAWSARCDCGEQLDEAARLMSLPSAAAGGVIVYLRQEGRGIGLGEKLKAYNLQDLGSDTVEANLRLRHPADARTYGLATAILLDLGLGGARGVRLLTNNPDKVRAVEGPGREVRVRERVAMIPLSWRTGGERGVRGSEIERYLETKVSGVPCARDARLRRDIDWQDGPYDILTQYFRPTFALWHPPESPSRATYTPRARLYYLLSPFMPIHLDLPYLQRLPLHRGCACPTCAVAYERPYPVCLRLGTM